MYGGGNVGLMGLLADAVLRAGGEAQGVIPEKLMAREVGHNGLTKLHVVRSMHERKALMADLADGFVALPGGFGTLEELAEVTTWAQLGLHAKPIGLLDVGGFFDPLLRFVDLMVAEQFVPEAHRRLLMTAATPEALIEDLLHWEPVTAIKWMPTGGEEPR